MKIIDNPDGGFIQLITFESDEDAANFIALAKELGIYFEVKCTILGVDVETPPGVILEKHSKLLKELLDK